MARRTGKADVDVLAVFITLAVDGEERAYSVRLSVPKSWQDRDCEALLRAFCKRANKTEAFAVAPLAAAELQLETVKDIGMSLNGADVGILFAGGKRRADLVATRRVSEKSHRAVGGGGVRMGARAGTGQGGDPGGVPALSSLKFKDAEEQAGALFQFVEILEQVRQQVRQQALADGVALAVGATRIDLAMAQTLLQATGVPSTVVTAAHPRENWYEKVHRGLLKIVPEALVGVYGPDRKPTQAEVALMAAYTTKEESNNAGLLKELLEDDPRGIRVPVVSERIRTSRAGARDATRLPTRGVVSKQRPGDKQPRFGFGPRDYRSSKQKPREKTTRLYTVGHPRRRPGTASSRSRGRSASRSPTRRPWRSAPPTRP